MPRMRLGLELGGQAVGVPAKASVHLLAAHRLEARHHVLGVAGEEVAVVGQAVGEGRAVVEDELVGALAVVDGRLERAVELPVLQHLGLEAGEVGRSGYVAARPSSMAMQRVASVRRVVLVPWRPSVIRPCHEDADGELPRSRGTTSLASVTNPEPTDSGVRATNHSCPSNHWSAAMTGCPSGSTWRPAREDWSPFFRKLAGDGRVCACDPSVREARDGRQVARTVATTGTALVQRQRTRPTQMTS